MTDDQFQELQRYDAAFRAEMKFRPEYKELPNGKYQFEIAHAQIERANDNRLILQVLLKVNDGGLFVWPHWLTDQDACNRCGAILGDLGFANQFAGGFALGLKKVLSRLRGLKFVGLKTTRPNSQKQGEFFHNLIVVGLTHGVAATGSPPTQAPPATAPSGQGTMPPRTPPTDTATNSGDDDGEIPFSWLIPLMPFFLLASHMMT